MMPSNDEWLDGLDSWVDSLFKQPDYKSERASLTDKGWSLIDKIEFDVTHALDFGLEDEVCVGGMNLQLDILQQRLESAGYEVERKRAKSKQFTDVLTVRKKPG